MKRLIIVVLCLLFLTGCYQQFYYQQRVEIVSGFYKGQTGTVVSILGNTTPQYLIRLDRAEELVWVFPDVLQEIQIEEKTND